MYALITVLIILASIALILVVLVQKSKGGGLASGFSSSNQIMGVRKTTDFIEKATWGLAGAVIVLSMISTLFIRSSQTPTGQHSEIQVPVLPTTGTPDVNTTIPMPGTSDVQPTEQPQQ